MGDMEYKIHKLNLNYNNLIEQKGGSAPERRKCTRKEEVHQKGGSAPERRKCIGGINCFS
ncbi:MAG: hypothetical protein ACRC30_14065 [Clostridium sp.]